MLKHNHLNRSIERCLLGAFIVIAAIGCGTSYRAPDLPMAQLAVVVAGANETSILAVDGLSTYNRLSYAGKSQVLLTSGKHILRVRRAKNSLVAEGDIEVCVEAGQHYVIRTKSEGYGVRFWLESETTEDTGPHRVPSGSLVKI